MSLNNDNELANSLEKLRELEERYESRRKETAANRRVHELTLHSLKHVINQIKEEVARYKSHQHAK